MMLTCKEVSRLASQGLDRQVGPIARLRLRLHLAICDGCRRFTRQMAFLRTALARLADSEKS